MRLQKWRPPRWPPEIAPPEMASPRITSKTSKSGASRVAGLDSSPDSSRSWGYSHLQNRLRSYSLKKILSTNHPSHFWRWQCGSSVKLPCQQTPIRIRWKRWESSSIQYSHLQNRLRPLSPKKNCEHRPPHPFSALAYSSFVIPCTPKNLSNLPE